MTTNDNWPTALIIEADVPNGGSCYLRRTSNNEYLSLTGLALYRQDLHELTNVTEFWPAGEDPAPELTPLEKYQQFVAWLKTLPDVVEVKKGDVVAFVYEDGTMETEHLACNTEIVRTTYLIHREPAPEPRVWQVGDIVDSTEDLPDGAIIVDAENDPWRWNTQRFVGRGGYSDVYDIVNPRLIWLPETEKAGE